MRFATIGAVALAFTIAAPQPAAGHMQDERTAFQSRIKSVLESVRAPLFNGSKALPGYSATYTVIGTGCRTAIEVAYPSHVIDNKNFAARTMRLDVDWSRVTALQTTHNTTYVRIFAPGLPEGNRYIFGASRTGEIYAAMQGLTRLCGGQTGASTPAPRPTPTPVSRPDPNFPAQIVAEWLDSAAIPRAWKVRYKGLDAGVHVYVYEADLRANPESHFLKGQNYLRRDICKDETLRGFLASGTHMRADTAFFGGGVNSRTERGEVLTRC